MSGRRKMLCDGGQIPHQNMRERAVIHILDAHVSYHLVSVVGALPNALHHRDAVIQIISLKVHISLAYVHLGFALGVAPSPLRSPPSGQC